MNKVRIFLCMAVSCAMLYLEAAKTRITLYNKSPEPILVSIGLRPMKPLAKSSVNKNEAKNFFLPGLNFSNRYYIVIEGSSDIDAKLYMIHLEGDKIMLERRNHLELDSLDAAVLQEYNKYLKVVYRGSLHPEVPEISFQR